MLLGSLDGGFFCGFRFDFLFVFESKLKGVGLIGESFLGPIFHFWEAFGIIFWSPEHDFGSLGHNFSILGGSLGSLGGARGAQGRPKSDFSDFLLNFPLIPPPGWDPILE